jgi:hypothetical protein
VKPVAAAVESLFGSLGGRVDKVVMHWALAAGLNRWGARSFVL